MVREKLLKRLFELEDGLTVGNYFERIKEINAIRAQLKLLRHASN